MRTHQTRMCAAIVPHIVRAVLPIVGARLASEMESGPSGGGGGGGGGGPIRGYKRRRMGRRRSRLYRGIGIVMLKLRGRDTVSTVTTSGAFTYFCPIHTAQGLQGISEATAMFDQYRVHHWTFEWFPIRRNTVGSLDTNTWFGAPMYTGVDWDSEQTTGFDTVAEALEYDTCQVKDTLAQWKRTVVPKRGRLIIDTATGLSVACDKDGWLDVANLSGNIAGQFFAVADGLDTTAATSYGVMVKTCWVEFRSQR